MFQGHPMGSLPLSPEDVTTAVGRDKGGSKKGNEKGGWEGCTDQGKEKRRKERGKKRAYVCFQNHWDFPGWFKAQRVTENLPTPPACPDPARLSQRATAKSVPVWNGERGLSSPWSRQGWELEGLGGVPEKAASQGAWLEGREACSDHRAMGLDPAELQRCAAGEQDPLRLLFQKKMSKCLVINNSRVSEAISKFTCKDVHKTFLSSGSTEVSEWETMLVCREQSPKEINLYFCQAGSFPGPSKQLREGGGCSAVHREELHPDVDLAGSRQICAILWAGSGQRYSPGISSRWEQLLGCYPQLWKLCLVFIPSDTSLPPCSKHLATPNLGFLFFFFFLQIIFPCLSAVTLVLPGTLALELLCVQP